MASAITVLVLNSSSGAPIASASVKLGTSTGSTDGSGKKNFSTTYKNVTLTVSKDGFNTYSSSVDVSSSKTITVNLNPAGAAPPAQEEPAPQQWPAAQTGSLWGTVKDSHSNKIIPGATIELAGQYSTVSRADGVYSFENINAATYELRAYASSYYDKSMTVNVVANASTKADVYLTSKKPPEEAAPAPVTPEAPSLPLPENWNQLTATEQQTLLNEISGMKSGAVTPVDWTDFALLIGPGSFVSLGKSALNGLFNTAKISIPRIAVLNEAGFINLLKTAPKAIQGIQIKTAEDLMELAVKQPQEVVSWYKALKPGELSSFLSRIKDPVIKYAVDQKIDRLVLDDAAKNMPLAGKLLKTLPSGKQMLLIGAGIAGIASWASVDNLTWVLTGGMRDLIQAKEYDKALLSITNARTVLRALYDNPIWQLVANVFTAGAAKSVYDGMFKFLDEQETIAKKAMAEGKLGSLSIKTIPSGATIWMDDKQQKYPSNSVLAEIAPGTHEIRVELKGYITFTESIDVKENKQAEFIHEFEIIEEEIPKTAGRLQWETTDSKTGAKIGSSFYINGRLEKSYASSYVIDLKPGTYELRWTAIGYEDYEDTVGIITGQLTDINARMVKLQEEEEAKPGVTCEILGYITSQPTDGREYRQVSVRGLTCWELVEITTGTVEISSNPAAEVWILGEKIAANTPVLLTLEQGVYDITLKAEGYNDETIRVYLNARQNIVRAVTLTTVEEEILPRKVWRIDVSSLPSSAKILINYAFTDKYTPDYILLDPGEYLLTLTKSGYKPYHMPLVLEEF